MSRAGAAGLACLFLAAPMSRAGDWNGSYSADGRCYCSGTLDPGLASRIVPTPLGGQSVARVCRRIGRGPGLSFVDGRFDRVVYADAQCGHGPSLADAAPPEPVCAGTMDPGGDDCRAVGPRWDLASAYARPTRKRSADVTASLIDAGVMGAPAVVPVMGAASPVAADAAGEWVGRVVEIDGRRWREAPEGTPEIGPPDTRIILDDRVYLDVEQARPADFLPRDPAPRRTAIAPAPKASDASARVRAARREPSPAEVRARQQRLLAEARERLRVPVSEGVDARRDRLLAEARERLHQSRPAAPRSTAAAPSARPERPSTPRTPTLAENDGSTGGRAKDPVPAIGAAAPVLLDRSSGETPAAASTPDIASVEASGSRDASGDERRAAALEEVAKTISVDGDGKETTSPFIRALRMPPGTRASSREFGYVDVLPTSYHYGGGGVMLEGSASMRGRFRALARLGATADYQEMLLGGSWHMTPTAADRLTVVLTAGVETGRFELERSGVSAELSDSGLYLGAESRFVVNGRFELQAGFGYSSFFEGDPIAFGSGFYHIGRRLDIVSRVEVGDNDSLGIGVRYYY